MKTSNRVGLVLAAFGAAFLFGTQKTQANSLPVYDLSEWQGTITPTQAKNLKTEVQGVILRVQYGSDYKDWAFDHNAKVLKDAGVKFGVYAFGQYTSASDAKQEAKDFYHRSKSYQPSFYVNDAEQLTTSVAAYPGATKAFAEEMQSLTKKNIVIYSYGSFYNSYIKSKAKYDKEWRAAYQNNRPLPVVYQLWQNTDHHYSTALGKAVDSSVVISGNWFGTSNAGYTVGGRIVGETVRVNKGTKFFQTKTTIDPSMTKRNLVIKQTKAIHSGKSNQAVLVANDSQVLGWVRAQDVQAYYSAPYVKQVKVTNKTGIYTYLHDKKQHWYRKGSVIKVSGYKTVDGVTRFVHQGHTTDLTANKDYVAWTQSKTTKKKSKHIYYTVRGGDSWWAIANRNGMSMYTLASRNGQSINSTIYPGQRLLIK